MQEKYNCSLCPVSSPPVTLAMGLSPRYHTGMLTSPIELPPKQEAEDGKYYLFLSHTASFA